jgi:hypothetical protein
MRKWGRFTLPHQKAEASLWCEGGDHGTPEEAALEDTGVLHLGMLMEGGCPAGKKEMLSGDLKNSLALKTLGDAGRGAHLDSVVTVCSGGVTICRCLQLYKSQFSSWP